MKEGFVQFIPICTVHESTSYEYAISLNDENIAGNIRDALLHYRDAVVTYLYKFHLSFEYSYALIEEITKELINS